MLNTVRQKHWRKTQLWGLHKTPGGSTLVRAAGVGEPVFQNPGITPGIIVSHHRDTSGMRGFEAKFRQSMKPHEVFMGRDEPSTYLWSRTHPRLGIAGGAIPH